jgi:hypothetical protein
MSLPVEIVLGIYLGILTGIIPGVVSWGLGFIFKYFTGVSIPGFGVVVLALAIAGVNGGLLALSEQSIKENTSAVVITTAIIVVLMISLYAHNKGDAMGATFPKRVTLQQLRERTLSTDVVELVGGRGQVRVAVAGEVMDMEGYPPVPADIRRDIREGSWPLPADIPLSELETRFAARLRTEFDLADVSVRIDERGSATVVAAPPLSGLSKRVPQGKRAVSVNAVVPTGLARGDVVSLVLPDATIEGSVLSADSGESTPERTVATDGGEGEDEAPPLAAALTTIGGEGRLTVAVSRPDAEVLLHSPQPKVVVQSRGTRREYELLSVLRRAGQRFQKLTVRVDGPLDGATLADAAVRDTYGVAVLAVGRPDGWVIAPRGSTQLSGGDELFAVGRRDALDAFAEAIA